MRKVVKWVAVALVIASIAACLLALPTDHEDDKIENDIFQDAYKQPIHFGAGLECKH